ncbi:MCE family protein [Pseudonocardia acidicola]|uniref:MCE family protein n=1 Tax=Pseudonocardia acidicola TaxID=2724939 RepID=A0ABX1S9M6_9PSEU|nr:MCE family protein [Pseudonocardia acidicola]NMH98274.1 MCE family protein [Pseudonocardia acidicola]
MKIPRFREINPLRTAIVGVSAMAVLIAGAFAIPSLPIVAGPTYEADFSEAGGMQVGDYVMVAGTKVGEVTDMELDGDKVHVSFTAKGVNLGDQTSAQIKTATLLGKRFLGLTPAGPGKLDGTIPLSRTTSPYNISDTLNTFTQQVKDFDKPKIEEALNAFSDAFKDTPVNFAATMQNVRALSDTISSRDAALRELLAHANAVSGVLNDRTAQFQSLIVDGNSLLAELQERQQVLDEMFDKINYVAEQARQFVNENNQQLGPVLDELNGMLGTIQDNDQNISLALERLGSFVGGLGEGIATGPRFNAEVYLGTQVFNYTDLLRQVENPQAPRLPGTPGLPGLGPLPNPLDAPPSGAGANQPNPQPPTQTPLIPLGGN